MHKLHQHQSLFILNFLSFLIFNSIPFVFFSHAYTTCYQVPIVILKTKDMRNSTNIFLINLSVADLLVLLICTPTVLVEVNSVPETWALGEHIIMTMTSGFLQQFYGKLVPFIELTVAHASILTILAISFERYYAICEPLKAGYVCTKTRAMIICVVCWFVAGLFTSPILEIANFHMEEYYDGSIVAVCLTTVETFWPSFFFIASITIFFLVPLLILIVLYSVIAKHLMVNPTLISAQGNRSNFIKYRKQVILMLAAVVISFFTCLLPFRAFTLWIILVPSETIMSLLSSERGIEVYYSVLYFCRCMWYLNSAMNPVLYNLMSSKFREGFVRLLGCKPLMRTTSWSDSARKGTFHTASTNLSSSNHHGNVGNSIEAHRLKIANLEVENLTTIERAPLNVIKYVKIVIEEKVECLDAEVGSDCEAEYEIIEDNQIDTKASENNVNNADNLNLSINSYPNKQKSNYKTKENVKISIKSHSNDKCSSADDEIDCDSNQEDFCINIYNLLSAKESLV
ncbi:CLUMA_CG003214, isoform A [Clunio marinus]|uniref:CLUMA_CG003214, isoform A n=1 Tax=Clunio marinus TaxID=568069 RepID=A0A1J1HQ11_9DIPT|nr:CLUMA_CG003214, isoform A [Clunio marinus]